MDSSFKISRAAIGRFARLGDLYDAREDQLMSENIFKTELKANDIYEYDANNACVDFIVTDSLKETFDKLGISAELSLSMLFGSVSVKESASYLHTQKTSARSARMTLMYAVRTIYQEVKDLCGKIDRDHLKTVEATHVVVGIDWGAKCTITCEYENTENEDKTEVDGKVGRAIDYLMGIVNTLGNGSVNFTKPSEPKFSYHSKSDVAGFDNTTPSTFEAAVQLASGFPSFVKKTNGGKGVPMTFKMLSLKTVRKMCNMQAQTEVIFKQIQADAIIRCFQTIEQSIHTRGKLNDLLKDLTENRNEVPEEDYLTALNLQNKFENLHAKFRSTMKVKLAAVRSNTIEEPSLHTVLRDFLHGEHSIDSINEQISSFDSKLNDLRDGHKINASQTILKLSKPIAQTAANIQRNIEGAERKTRELRASRKTESELQDTLYLDAIDLQVIHLDNPQTVCTHTDCIEHVQVSDNTRKIVYRQICHNHCHLSGIPTETINNAGLRDCRAMGDEPNYDCMICGHSWKLHMHLTYNLDKVKIRIIDSIPSTQQSASENIENFIQDVKLYGDDLKQEEEQITDISAQFECYMQKVAGTPFNADVDAHLALLIQNERDMPERNQETIDNLQSMRRTYAKKKEVITLAMKGKGYVNVDYISNPKAVDELKDRLFNLKRSGPSLKDIFTNRD